MSAKNLLFESLVTCTQIHDMPLISFKNAVVVAVCVRLGLVFYSEYHDRRAVVKYTDVDYRVFTDAARFLLKPADNNNIAEGPFGHYMKIGR